MSEERGRILVVDDDPVMRLSVEGILSDNFDVRTAGGVPEALAALRETLFDVVITDYEMPGATGLDLIRQLRGENPDVMVLCLTGHSSLPELTAAETTHQVVRVLEKPYEPPRLLRWVENAVGLARLRQSMSRLKTVR